MRGLGRRSEARPRAPRAGLGQAPPGRQVLPARLGSACTRVSLSPDLGSGHRPADGHLARPPRSPLGADSHSGTGLRTAPYAVGHCAPFTLAAPLALPRASCVLTGHASGRGVRPGPLRVTCPCRVRLRPHSAVHLSTSSRSRGWAAAACRPSVSGRPAAAPGRPWVGHTFPVSALFPATSPAGPSTSIRGSSRPARGTRTGSWCPRPWGTSRPCRRGKVSGAAGGADQKGFRDFPHEGCEKHYLLIFID